MSSNTPRSTVGLSKLSSIVLACALLLTRQVYAVPADLTLDQALQQAEQNNPNLAAAGWSIAVAQGERIQAGLIPNPELSFEVEDTRSDTRTSTVQLTQPIELGGKRGARIRLAERGSDAAALELERSRNELRSEVILAFYGQLRARMRVDLAEESLRLTERGTTIAEGRVKAGKVSPIELTRAQVQMAEVQLELNRSRKELASANARLQVVLGGDLDTSLLPVGDATLLPATPDKSILLKALDSSADMRLARLGVDQQEASFELEKTLRIPDISVSLGSQYSAEDRERVNVVGLSMPLPLFNRNQGNVLAAARRADQARDQRNATELRLQGTLQETLDQWDAAASEIESFKTTILPSAQKAVDSTVRGFEMGKFGFIDVLDAQRTLIQGRLQYLLALEAATQSWSQLERIYGDIAVIARSRQ